MMALNRYRLKHLKAIGHRGARKASRLLSRTDRLIGLILIVSYFLQYHHYKPSLFFLRFCIFLTN